MNITVKKKKRCLMILFVFLRQILTLFFRNRRLYAQNSKILQNFRFRIRFLRGCKIEIFFVRISYNRRPSLENGVKKFRWNLFGMMSGPYRGRGTISYLLLFEISSRMGLKYSRIPPRNRIRGYQCVEE